ncbi:MAG: Tad domain-containing protein [Acidobacteria bacterium]|nr:Tad domain-containing protein [Acidobacteriota bacterium]MBI3278663.1 Tad domain-containing protein [Acidobacteriota bacterium]
MRWRAAPQIFYERVCWPSRPPPGLRRPRQKGFTLLTTAMCLIAMIGMAGVAVDISRMFIAKNESQTYADSAALAAALELDGTQEGFTRARSRVSANPNGWDFATRNFSGSAVEFAKTETGPWQAAPENAKGYKCARVIANVPVPLLFIPVITGTGQGAFLMIAMTADVRADSAAGQVVKTSFREGIFPFSPFAHDTAGPHFGLEPGQVYTLRWASKPRLNQNVCAGDNSQQMISLAEAGGGEERGYIEETSSDVIRSAIEGDYQSVVREIGEPVNMTGGAKQTQLSSMINRINQDTDATSAAYADYTALNTGNGRRIVVVPINLGHPQYTIVQYAAFFLLPVSEYSAGGNSPFCAEYIGAWVQGSSHKGGDESGAYVVRLVR